MSDLERDEHARRRSRRGVFDVSAPSDPISIPGKQSGTAGLGEGRNGPYREPTLGARGRFYAGPDGGSRSNAGGETREIAYPDDGGPGVDVDSKYTIRRKTEHQLHIGPIPAKLELRWEFSLKDKGTARHGIPGQKGDVSWGANQALVEKSEKGLNAKVSTAFVTASFDLLSEGRLPEPLGVLVPKVEIKGFEAALSSDGPELKAMSLSLIIDDEFTQFLDDSVRDHLEVRGQVRLECAIDAELAKQIIEMSRAANDVARGLAVESKIAKTEKQIAYWTRFRHKDKVAKLEKELGALRAVRDRVGKAKDVALRKLEQIGLSLEKTAGGRLVKKLGSKALSLVFKKFIPVFNVVSTAQDVYEVVNYLRGLDWKSIGDRIANGGDGGTTFSDGSHDGEPGGGAGFGEGGTGDAGDVDANSIESELQQEENVELSAAAQAVLGVVEAKSGDGETHQPLSNEDKETLNHVVPPDLSPEEVEAIKARVSTSTGSQQSLVTSVIAAIQQVRPFGTKKLGPVKESEVDSQVADASDNQEAKQGQEASLTPAQASKQTSRKRNKARSGTWIVDPVPVLQRVIEVDEAGNVSMPDRVQFAGFQAAVRKLGVARLSFGTGEAGSTTSFMVRVELRPIGAQTGFFWKVGNDVRPVDNNESISDITVVVSARRPDA